MSRRPPRLARWIISAVTERNERPWLVADLDELYQTRVSRRGGWHADVWYCQQVVRSIAPLVGRLSSRADRPSNSTNPCQRLTAMSSRPRNSVRRSTIFATRFGD